MRLNDGRCLYITFVEFGRNDHREDVPHFISSILDCDLDRFLENRLWISFPKIDLSQLRNTKIGDWTSFPEIGLCHQSWNWNLDDFPGFANKNYGFQKTNYSKIWVLLRPTLMMLLIYYRRPMKRKIDIQKNEWRHLIRNSKKKDMKQSNKKIHLWRHDLYYDWSRINPDRPVSRGQYFIWGWGKCMMLIIVVKITDYGQF